MRVECVKRSLSILKNLSMTSRPISPKVEWGRVLGPRSFRSSYFFRVDEEIIEPSGATAEDGDNSRGVS